MMTENNKIRILTYNIYLINLLLAIAATVGMTIIPLLVIDSLGLSIFLLGIIEGLSEFFSSTIRFYSGYFFDKKENKFELLFYPLYLALLSKLILLHPSSFSIIITKFIERLSNGAFGPLRDSLILKLSQKEGESLSLLNISKSLGCLIGPLLVTTAMSLSFNINNLIVLCIALCTLAITILYFLKKTPIKFNKIDTEKITFNLNDIKKMKKIYPALALCSIFFLARFSDGLIIIFLKDLNSPQWIYLSTIGIFNGFMLLISPFIGKYLDKGCYKYCLLFTFLSLLFFNITCLNMKEANLILIILSLLFWGAQRVSAQMSFLFLIKKNIINEKYIGRAVGVYSLLSGISLMIAAFICGYLAKISFTYVFIYSAIMTCIGLALYIYIYKKQLI